MDTLPTGQDLDNDAAQEKKQKINGEFNGSVEPEINQAEVKFNQGEVNCTRKDLAMQLGVSGAAITKILREIEKSHESGDLYDRANRLTPFAQREVRRYREIGASEYKAQNRPQPTVQSNLAVYDDVSVPSFESEQIDQLDPHDLLELLAIAQHQSSAQLARQEANTQRSNYERLQQTIAEIEDQNALARGYEKAAREDKLEEQGRLAYLQEKLKQQLGESWNGTASS
jgi:hypothetical protein